jgi:hypothetical protein
VYHPNKPPDNDFPRSWDVYFKANGDDGGCRLNETLYNNVCPSDEPLSSFYDWELANLTVAQLGLAKHMSTPFFIAAGLRRPHRVWHVPRRFYDLYENNGTDPTAITLAKHKTGPTGMPEIAFIDNAWYVSHALALAAAPRSDISECICIAFFHASSVLVIYLVEVHASRHPITHVSTPRVFGWAGLHLHIISLRLFRIALQRLVDGDTTRQSASLVRV